MEKRAAFKIGFLRACANAGLSLEETHAVVKQALSTVNDGNPAEKQASGLGMALWGLASGAGQKTPEVAMDLAGKATLAGLGASAGVGALGGLSLAQLQNYQATSPEEIKAQETIDEYRRAAERARLQRKLREQREQRRGSRLLL